LDDIFLLLDLLDNIFMLGSVKQNDEGFFQGNFYKMITGTGRQFNNALHSLSKMNFQ